MVKVSEFVKFMDNIFKINYFTDIVKNGLVLSLDLQRRINRVGLAVDLTPFVLRKLIQKNFDFLILHHSPMHRGLERITPPKSNILETVLNKKISIYVSHLPMDCHKKFGHSHILAKKLNLTESKPFPSKKEPFGVIGKFKSDLKKLENLLDSILSTKAKKILNSPTELKKLAIVSGAGGSLIDAAIEQGANLFITGEIKYSDFINSLENNISVWLYGHHNTELLGLFELSRHLKRKFDFEVVEVIECEIASQC